LFLLGGIVTIFDEISGEGPARREAERELRELQNTGKESAAKEDSYRTRDNSTTAYSKARDAVQQRLKSPSTASFPSMWGGEWDAHTTRGPDGDRHAEHRAVRCALLFGSGRDERCREKQQEDHR
jgi:hypothetical protein